MTSLRLLILLDPLKAGEVSSAPCCRPKMSAADKPSTVKRPPPDPLLPRDDLRAYAYEGDGSSAGSLGSAKAGQPQVFFTKHGLAPECFLSKLIPQLSKLLIQE